MIIGCVYSLLCSSCYFQYLLLGWPTLVLAPSIIVSPQYRYTLTKACLSFIRLVNDFHLQPYMYILTRQPDFLFGGERFFP